jgi:hypothetical protein
MEGGGVPDVDEVGGVGVGGDSGVNGDSGAK